MLSGYFTARGYKILTAKSGRGALEQVKRRPDLILTDINMPDMDGFRCAAGCKRSASRAVFS